MLVVVMMLKDTATFQVLFIVSLFWSTLGTPLLWRSTVAFTYLKDKSAKTVFTSGGLGLGLALLVWVLHGLVSSGLGLGLVLLVLVLVLVL